MRLDKFVCKSTQLNRAQAIDVINQGLVWVNGVAIVNNAAQVHEQNEICLSGEVLTLRPFRYVLIHKPMATICSNVDEQYPSIFSALDLERCCELHIAGRLDADTTGLVLATDDGRWSFNIMRPTKRCEKVYRVGLAQPIALDAAAKFAHGVALQGEAQLTLPATLEVISAQDVRLTITEGKFHQVKRMFAAIGNRVVSLHREKIGGITLDVRVGQWRALTATEIRLFASESELDA